MKSKGLLWVIVGVEMGPWRKEGKEWLKQLGQKIIEVIRDIRDKHLFMQGLSVVIQRGNVSCCIFRVC